MLIRLEKLDLTFSSSCDVVRFSTSSSCTQHKLKHKIEVSLGSEQPSNTHKQKDRSSNWMYVVIHSLNVHQMQEQFKLHAMKRLRPK